MARIYTRLGVPFYWDADRYWAGNVTDEIVWYSDGQYLHENIKYDNPTYLDG